ncbi:MAG: hypothetical protein QG622_133, partial [Actinomycetota bacterium]|nr:hypothetical protein [Actinomycetota bacterium]
AGRPPQPGAPLPTRSPAATGGMRLNPSLRLTSPGNGGQGSPPPGGQGGNGPGSPSSRTQSPPPPPPSRNPEPPAPAGRTSDGAQGQPDRNGTSEQAGSSGLGSGRLPSRRPGAALAANPLGVLGSGQSAPPAPGSTPPPPPPTTPPPPSARSGRTALPGRSPRPEPASAPQAEPSSPRFEAPQVGDLPRRTRGNALAGTPLVGPPSGPVPLNGAAASVMFGPGAADKAETDAASSETPSRPRPTPRRSIGDIGRAPAAASPAMSAPGAATSPATGRADDALPPDDGRGTSRPVSSRPGSTRPPFRPGATAPQAGASAATAAAASARARAEASGRQPTPGTGLFAETGPATATGTGPQAARAPLPAPPAPSQTAPPAGPATLPGGVQRPSVPFSGTNRPSAPSAAPRPPAAPRPVTPRPPTPQPARPPMGRAPAPPPAAAPPPSAAGERMMPGGYVPKDDDIEMIGVPDSDVDLSTPIFDSISAWFSKDTDKPSGASGGPRVIDLRDSAPANSLAKSLQAGRADRNKGGDKGGGRWAAMGDQQWLDVNVRAAAGPSVAGNTGSGLPRRQPGANLLPSSAAEAAPAARNLVGHTPTGSPSMTPSVPAADGPTGTRPDAEAVRGRLGSYQRGLTSARRARHLPGESTIRPTLGETESRPQDGGQRPTDQGGDQ